jgi:hypothetical protein
MIKYALHQVLRLPNYIISLDHFIFTTIKLVILLSYENPPIVLDPHE